MPVDAGRSGPSGRPVRFGVAVPAAHLEHGLSLRGPGQLSWRRLPIGGRDADPVWVEVALCGVRGRAVVAAGSSRGSRTGRTGSGGAAVERSRTVENVEHGERIATTWRWADGTIDRSVRTRFREATTIGGATFAASEVRRSCRVPSARHAVVAALPRRLWERAGVLPERDGSAARLPRLLRRELQRAARQLVELPGERGAGDHARGDGTVTNNEFDTGLALLRLGLAIGDATIVARGVRCAHHLVDCDLDRATGLPFPHGPGHRTGMPEPGHVWLQGLLLAGLLTADDELIHAARAMGRALAARPPMAIGGGTGDDAWRERARDFAWPLLELEGLLLVDPDPVVAAAADRLATAIGYRFDEDAATFRFGEGEVGPHVYFERAWLTAGLVLPALRRHLARRPDPGLAQQVAAAENRILEQVGGARGGVPTHWRVVAGRVVAEHRVEHDARAVFLLAGLSPRARRRLLRREELGDALRDVVPLDDPDLPTTFTLVARTSWVYR